MVEQSTSRAELLDAAPPGPRRSLLWSFAVPASIAVATLVTGIAFYAPHAVVETAMENAVQKGEHTAKQLQSLRTFYTENVVAKLGKDAGVKASPTHKGEPATVPVPTTFILDFAQAFADDHVQVGLVSPFPWPTRSGRGLDDFQRQAWDHLQKNPAGRFTRRENLKGQEVLRVAVADTMNASCVSCHNSHPQSPKADWKVGDVRGVVEVVQSVDAVLAGARDFSWKLVAGVVLAGLLLLAALLANGLRLVRPLRGLVAAIQDIAAARLDRPVPYVDRGDEIGVVARALKTMRAQTAERADLQNDVAREVEARRAQLDRFRELAGQFDGDVQGLIGDVTSVAGEMKRAADELARLASSTEQAADGGAVRAATFREAGTEVLKITSEFTTVFDIVGRGVAESTATAKTAVAKTVETNEVVRKLSNNAQRIGDIVGLIGDIAAQTNLLALNATIEAARAGEAGRGFSIVAQEVKGLADRIAKATVEVSGQIAQIQAETGQAVSAISTIGETIQAASTVSASLVEQVDGQRRSSMLVTGHIHETIEGAERISATLSTILSNASATRQRAAAVAEAASQVSATLERLNAEAGGFSRAMRVA